MDRSRRILIMVLCTIIYTALHICAAQAATLPCAGGDVACLIAAINTANSTPEPDTIQLAAGTYTLTAPDNATSSCSTGLPVITSPLTIQGQGADLTAIRRDPGAPTSFRLMSIAASGVLTLDGLTLRGGANFYCGGGLSNDGGTVTLTRVRVSENRTGYPGGAGLYTRGGTVSIAHSVFADNDANSHGGGLLSEGGTVTVTQTTFSGGFGDPGGGIAMIGGTVTISDSTIVDNYGYVNGGGGLFNGGGTLTLISSTVAHNKAHGYSGGGGLKAIAGTTRILNSTIVENGIDQLFGTVPGGIAVAGGTVELQNTILARNLDATGQASDCMGPVTSLGHNVVGDPVGCTIVLQPTDLVGDPDLDVFTDDGLPGHGHYPLLATSQAVDAGNPFTCPLTDQLGRQRSGPCDLGAVEFQPVLPPALTLTMNQSQFRSGETVRVALHIQQTGPTVTGDFYFGVILPDGQTAFFLSNEGWVQARLDNPRAFRPLARHAVLAQGLDLTFDPFFTYTFHGADAPGVYTIFALFTPPDAFDDDRIDAGDLLALELKSLHFGPSGLVAQLPANVQAIRDRHMNK